jgi:hypothetical protein
LKEYVRIVSDFLVNFFSLCVLRIYVTRTDQESGRKAEHCRIDNKTEDDRALTLVSATEPRSTSHRRGRDTREAKPNQIHDDYSIARLLLIWAQVPANNPLTNC